jgi:hypothetical protein
MTQAHSRNWAGGAFALPGLPGATTPCGPPPWSVAAGRCAARSAVPRKVLRVVEVPTPALGPGQTIGLADISRAFRAGGVPGKIAVISALALLGFGDFAMIQRISRGSNLGCELAGLKIPQPRGGAMWTFRNLVALGLFLFGTTF